MIIAVLQARMSSSRLEGKVLMPILGKPMLAHQVDRVIRSRLIDKLVIATSTDPSDDSIENLCLEMNIECFRGDLDNVLDRYYQCCEKYRPDVIVRLTGDCPLTDPEVIDATITFFIDNKCDYVTNCGPKPTLPDGLDVEVFTANALKKAKNEAELPSEKEHVTQYINNHPEKFKKCIYETKPSISNYRWTVDEPSDFEFVSKVYEHLYLISPRFKTREILELLKRKPWLSKINNTIERNEGLIASLAKDEEYLKIKGNNEK